MFVACAIMTGLLAAVLVASAAAKLTRVDRVVENITGAGVPLGWFPWLAATELAGAGFVDSEIAANDDPLRLAEAELEAFASFTLEAGAAREALREHPDRASVAGAVLAALRERAEGGTVTLGAAAWIVHARA